ncbi:type I restriction enzyme HsdR N-terminal domain-containing protein [Persicobacter diffluens]|uniref:Restriction endonuclease subunit R n=1 Tax=Persicobacter diffluens TaxID=981 RepID=A0AAN4VYL1_9BACT|nr:restriction endonuclease subunit R [Persicobacter diffluens]
MEKLNLPSFPFRIREDQGRKYIFDPLRKKEIVLTPEEWVRQHFIQYLINSMGYPASLIALETGLKYNRIQKRSDGLVFDRNGQPFMLIECKAPSVKLDQKVVQQAATYNQTLRAPYIVVTNGLSHGCLQCNAEGIKWLAQLPDFPQ